MDELTDFERAINSISQLTILLAAYYKSLVEQGFTPQQAFDLTARYQDSVTAQINKTKGS